MASRMMCLTEVLRACASEARMASSCFVRDTDHRPIRYHLFVVVCVCVARGGCSGICIGF
ncbi:MAG: hypothetical protein ACXQTS_02515 [Candidatus Methanospirareceae archaeon]